MNDAPIKVCHPPVPALDTNVYTIEDQKHYLFNLDRQLPVKHVKLEVGFEVAGQSFPLRLLEASKPS